MFSPTIKFLTNAYTSEFNKRIDEVYSINYNYTQNVKMIDNLNFDTTSYENMIAGEITKYLADPEGWWLLW